MKLLRAKRIVRADCLRGACMVSNHITRGVGRSSWLLALGESLVVATLLALSVPRDTSARSEESKS